MSYPPPFGFNANSPYPPQAGFPVPPAAGQSPYPPNYPNQSPYPTGGFCPPPFVTPPGQYQVTTDRPYVYPGQQPGHTQVNQYPSANQTAPGYPAYTPSPQGYPPPSGYPAPTNTDYPPNSSAGYPPNPSTGYPPNPSAGYPANQSSGYPPNASSAQVCPNLNRGTATADNNKMAYYQAVGTVQEHHPFDANSDAGLLRKAMKGLGTDEKTIIEVLGRRTNKQRQLIIVSFKTQFGKDLIKDLKSELSGKLEDAIVGLMTPIPLYLAQALHSAISGFGTKDHVLIEVLCTRTNQEIKDIVAAYNSTFGSLEKDISGDTSGNFQRLLISCSQGNRDESTHVDQGAAIADAQALYNAGEGQWGTDESTFNSILVSRSYAHLNTVFIEYSSIAGKPIEEAIKSEFGGDIQDGLLAVVKSVQNRPAYFAERIHHAMKGLGTDDKSLIRLIVTRCEIDMFNIKEEFYRQFGLPLEQAISNETSGDYKRILMKLIEKF